jgi:DNA polymerase-3 subunit epsilon
VVGVDFVAVDVETANPSMASICQVGLATFQRGRLTATFSTLIDPEDNFENINVSIHGIDADNVAGAPTFPKIL